MNPDEPARPFLVPMRPPLLAPMELPGGTGQPDEILSLLIRRAAMGAQRREAWSLSLPRGCPQEAKTTARLALLFAAIWQYHFDNTDQTVRQLIATNVSLLFLTAGIQADHLLARHPILYARPILLWGDLTFILWDDQDFRSGRHDLKLTLTGVNIGYRGVRATLLSFASLPPANLDRDTTRLMFLLALKVGALPASAMDFLHPEKGVTLLASDAAATDPHGRRYIKLRAQQPMANTPVFAYQALSPTGTPLPVKTGYTLQQYESDIRSAMRSKYPGSFNYQDLRRFWTEGVTKNKPGFERYPVGDPDAPEMMEHAYRLFLQTEWVGPELVAPTAAQVNLARTMPELAATSAAPVNSARTEEEEEEDYDGPYY